MEKLQEMISYAFVIKSLYKHVSDFGLLRRYGLFKFRKEGEDY